MNITTGTTFKTKIRRMFRWNDETSCWRCVHLMPLYLFPRLQTNEKTVPFHFQELRGLLTWGTGWIFRCQRRKWLLYCPLRKGDYAVWKNYLRVLHGIISWLRFPCSFYYFLRMYSSRYWLIELTSLIQPANEVKKKVATYSRGFYRASRRVHVLCQVICSFQFFS